MATKRASLGSIMFTSAISSALASRSRPPKLSAKAWRSSLHDSRRMRERIVSARSRQKRMRSGRPSAAAIFASRSQAAQLMSAEDVWMRARVRSSHIPASGVS